MNVTLVVPTHNRPRKMQRLVRYYQEHAPCLPLVVLDSSDQSNVPQGPAGSTSYLHLPRATFVSKVCHGLSHVTTPFVVLCPDDYLIHPDAITTCCDFLETHEDYAAAEGFSLALTKLLGKAIYTNYAIEGLTFHAASGSALERVSYLLDPNHYYAFIYSCQRTESTRRAWSLLQDSAIASPYLMEYTVVSLLAIEGKAIVLPTPYALITGFVFRRPSPYPNIHSIVRTQNAEYPRAVALLANALATRDHLAIPVCEAKVLEAFQRFNPPKAPPAPTGFLGRAGSLFVRALHKPFYLLGREDLLWRLIFLLRGWKELLTGPSRARRLIDRHFGYMFSDPELRDKLFTMERHLS